MTDDQYIQELPHGGSIRSFSSLQEVSDYLAENQARADRGISPVQKAITWGDYVIRILPDLFIFGHIITEDERDEEPAVERLKESYAANWRYGKYYSVVEPEGEWGAAHAVSLWPISPEDFGMAKANGWELTPELSDKILTQIEELMKPLLERNE